MARLVVNMRDSRPIWSIPDWAIDEIRAAAPPGMEVVAVDAPADGRGDGGPVAPEAGDAIAGAEIYFGFGFPLALFRAANDGGGQLRWVHSGAAGVGGALYPEMMESDIILTNSAGIHAEPVADSVLAMMYYFARGIDFAVHGQLGHRWAKESFESHAAPLSEIEGSTVGVVGLGGIGRAVAERARRLGMRVLALRRRPGQAPDGVEVVYGEEGLQRLLQESHYVVLTLPRTSETEGILDAGRIAQLRRDAVLINVGRGELVDEDALAEALGHGTIRGAALDVFREEPLPPSSPLWGLPNALLTPHVSATTHRFWRRQLDLIVENLRRYRAREPLLNKVDKRAGY